jgi:integrase
VAVDQRVTVASRKRKNVLGKRTRAWTDLPELVEGMLSTGLRIGEATALIGDDVDLDGREVHAGHHLVRIEGVGMVRKPKRKGNRPGLTAAITSWTLAMWRRRKLESGGSGPLWATWNGQWLDPGNVAKRINEICVEIGYEWVSSRYFRHTTATHLGDSDLTDTAISDALGNTPDVVRKHYRRPRQSNPAVAAALESLLDQ